MKKALYVATVDIHIKTFHLPYLELLHEMGYEVHVATNGIEQFPYCDKKFTIPIKRSPYSLKNLKAIKELKNIIDTENYDIIHCHTPMGSVVTRLAAKQARKNGTRVIYTAHGFHFYKGAPLINWMLFYPIEWYLAKYTDTIITINSEDYSLAKKKFSQKCKNIKYISGIGVDDTKFRFSLSMSEKKTYKKNLGLKNNDFIMIFPARLDKNKNQILLINIMEKLVKSNNNIHLLLPGSDEMNGYYQKIVLKRNLSNNIHFLGFRNDIPNLMKISNLAISSSIREGFGINLVEALCCGIPVIAVNNRGHRDIIVNGVNGFLTNYDENEIIDKILLIYNKKAKLVPKMGIDKFLLTSSIEKMRCIYLEKK